MNLKLNMLASALLALLLVAPATMAYTASRTVLAPGAVNDPNPPDGVTGLGSLGLAFCESISQGVVPATYCHAGGFGAFFTDIGCSNDGTTILNFNGVPDNAAGCLDDLPANVCGAATARATGSGEGVPTTPATYIAKACPLGNDGIPGTNDPGEVDPAYGCDPDRDFIVEHDCGDNDARDPVADGSCTVRTNTETVPVTANHGFYYLCGSDRDDDTVVTNGDDTGSSDCGADTVCGPHPVTGIDDDCAPNSDGVPQCFDDDLVSGSLDPPVLNPPNPPLFSTSDTSVFCIGRDRNNDSHPNDVPAAGAPNAANHDFDDVVVFVGVNDLDILPGGNDWSVGSLTVDVTLASGAACLGHRSGHTHDHYYG